MGMTIYAATRPIGPVAILLTAFACSVAQNAIADDSWSTQTQNIQTDPSLEIIAGIDWLDLPSWNSQRNDLLHGSDGSRLTDDGLNLGFRLEMPIGNIASQPVALEWSGRIADLSSSSSSRANLAGQNAFDMRYGSSANGAIDALTASSRGILPAAATADVTVSDSAGGTATITSSASSAAGGRITQFASSSSGSGGAFTALVTNGDAPTAASYAAYADNTGFTLRALGDLSNSSLIATRSERAIVVDQTLLLGMPVDLSDSWSLTPKLGPTYRSINRDVDFSQTLDIGESVAGSSVPSIGIEQNDRLEARYVGALGALTVTKWVRPDLSVSLDAKLGGAYVHSQYQSRYSANIPNVSIASFDAPDQTRNDVSLLAGLNAGLQYTAKENVVLGLGAGVDFIGTVPTISYAGTAIGAAPAITTSHAISYGVSVTVTWRF
jgi:hypothetical protein